MINCIPYGGISNRMKCIISSIAEYEVINLQWDSNPSVGGVRCEFSDLYENVFECEYKKSISDCKFIHSNMNTHNTGIDKGNVDFNLQQSYLEVIDTLRPIKYIRERVLIEKDILGDFDTVAVRTFKSFPREQKSWGYKFNLDKLYRYMDNVKGKILLTCDDTDTVSHLKERYDIYTTDKRTKFGDFSSVEGMQDILIDLYLGGLSKTIYGTKESSFTEMQWWLGRCKPNYVNMNLH